MARPARAWPGLLLLLAGCTESQPLLLPPEAAQAKGLLLAAEPSLTSPLYASVDVAGLPKLVGDYEHVALLLYDAPLDSLGIPAGEVRLASLSETSRPLPAASSQFLFEPASDDRFRPLSAVPEWLAALRLPDQTRLAPEACLEAGGCYQGQEQLRAGECKLPCGVIVEAPLAPEPVLFGPCPSGWIVHSSGAHQRCEPPPRVAAGCPRGQVQFVGDASCHPLGPECPSAGDFREPTVPGRLYYVRAGAAPNGDGTRNLPFDNLPAALARAAAGDSITLSADSYPSNGLRLKDGVNLIGACAAAAGTRLVSSSTFALVIAGSSTVSGLSIEGGSGGGVVVDAAGVLLLQGVELVGANSGQGIQARGGLIAREIKSAGFEYLVAQGTNATTLNMDQVSASGHSKEALLLRGPGDVALSRLWLSDGQHHAVSSAEGSSGQRLSIRASGFQRHVGTTIFLAGRAQVQLADLDVRDTLDLVAPNGGVERGAALFQSQGLLLGNRLYLAGHRFAGLWIQEANATLEDVWVEQTGLGGGVRLEVGQGIVARFYSSQTGVAVWTSGAQLNLLDADVEGGEVPLSAERYSTVQLTRARLQDMSGAGILMASSNLVLASVQIQGGLQGMHVFSGTVSASRIQILDPVRTADPGTAIGALIEPDVNFSMFQFELTGCERSGFAFNGDRWEISDGILRRNGYGVVVHELDIGRLSQRIWYQENAVPILSVQ